MDEVRRQRLAAKGYHWNDAKTMFRLRHYLPHCETCRKNAHAAYVNSRPGPKIRGL